MKVNFLFLVTLTIFSILSINNITHASCRGKKCKLSIPKISSDDEAKDLILKIKKYQKKFNGIGRILYKTKSVEETSLDKIKYTITKFLHTDNCYIGTAIKVIMKKNKKVVAQEEGPIDLRKINLNKIELLPFNPGPNFRKKGDTFTRYPEHNWGWEINFDTKKIDFPNLYFKSKGKREKALKLIEKLAINCQALDSYLEAKEKNKKKESKLTEVKEFSEEFQGMTEKFYDALPAADLSKIGIRKVRPSKAEDPIQVAWLSDGLHAFQARLKIMDMAKGVGDSIAFEHLITMADHAGRALSEKMIEKRALGVDVEVIVDALSAFMDPRDLQVRYNTYVMYNNLMSAGIPVYGFKCSKNYALSGRLAKEAKKAIRESWNKQQLVLDAFNQRSHEKFTIVKYWDADQEKMRLVSISGGRNIGNDYMGINDEGYDNWRDLDELVIDEHINNDRYEIFRGNVQTYRNNYKLPVYKEIFFEDKKRKRVPLMRERDDGRGVIEQVVLKSKLPIERLLAEKEFKIINKGANFMEGGEIIWNGKKYPINRGKLSKMQGNELIKYEGNYIEISTPQYTYEGNAHFLTRSEKQELVKSMRVSHYEMIRGKSDEHFNKMFESKTPSEMLSSISNAPHLKKMKEGMTSKEKDSFFLKEVHRRHSADGGIEKCFNPFHPVGEEEFYNKFKEKFSIEYDDSIPRDGEKREKYEYAQNKVRESVDKVNKLSVFELFNEIEEVYKARVVHNVPKRNGEVHIEDAYIEMIDQAQDKIIISNAYFIPSIRLVNALQRAGRRGVSIEILTNSYENNDVKPVAWLYRKRLKKLVDPMWPIKRVIRKNGSYYKDRIIKIYEWMGREEGAEKMVMGTNHSKFMIVDPDSIEKDDRNEIIYKALTFNGSYNLDPRSRNINSEVGVIFQDSKLAMDAEKGLGQLLAKRFYEEDLKFAKQIEYSQIVEWSMPPKLFKAIKLSHKGYFDYIGDEKSFFKLVQDMIGTEFSEFIGETL